MNGPLHLWLIPLLPFAGFLLNGLLGRRLPKWLVTTVALLAPLAAFGAVLGDAFLAATPMELRSWNGLGPVPHLLSFPYIETFGQWINVGTFHIDFTFVLDPLSLLMLLVVTGLGFLIHIYSVGYMHDEEGYARYFSSS